MCRSLSSLRWWPWLSLKCLLWVDNFKALFGGLWAGFCICWSDFVVKEGVVRCEVYVILTGIRSDECGVVMDWLWSWDCLHFFGAALVRLYKRVQDVFAMVRVARWAWRSYCWLSQVARARTVGGFEWVFTMYPWLGVFFCIVRTVVREGEVHTVADLM